jgi:hypothetical protein
LPARVGIAGLGRQRAAKLSKRELDAVGAASRYVSLGFVGCSGPGVTGRVAGSCRDNLQRKLFAVGFASHSRKPRMHFVVCGREFRCGPTKLDAHTAAAHQAKQGHDSDEDAASAHSSSKLRVGKHPHGTGPTTRADVGQLLLSTRSGCSRRAYRRLHWRHSRRSMPLGWMFLPRTS